jgi:hypothetical protein
MFVLPHATAHLSEAIGYRQMDRRSAPVAA